MGESLEKEPLFSIILPIYNVEEYLEECVNSVLSQDCSDYEIVLVDDGSLDKSGA
nr:glycosyltransferase [Lachnospiraceae bacterium]MCR4934305.1 glycosyltransferase [Lachnospiraceae bacterium]